MTSRPARRAPVGDSRAAAPRAAGRGSGEEATLLYPRANRAPAGRAAHTSYAARMSPGRGRRSIRAAGAGRVQRGLRSCARAPDAVELRLVPPGADEAEQRHHERGVEVVRLPQKWHRARVSCRVKRCDPSSNADMPVGKDAGAPTAGEARQPAPPPPYALAQQRKCGLRRPARGRYRARTLSTHVTGCSRARTAANRRGRGRRRSPRC
jgi:hypothetical protein